MTAAAALPLTLTRRIDGPWLAIRRGTPAEAASIVLAGDPRAPTMWRRIAASEPMEAGSFDAAELIPLRAFGVFCTLYPHSRVLSVWRPLLSLAWWRDPRWAGQHWQGPRVDRIRIERGMVALLKAAVDDCNTLGRVRS